MNKTIKIILWIIVAIIVVGGVWYGVSRKPIKEKVVKVGVLTPLSGPAAFYGENILKGVECAKKFVNNTGGINAVPIELTVEDSKCDGKTALTAAIKLSDIDKVTGIIGQACSAATIPVGAVAKDKKFVLIASAASNPKVTENPYVFRVNLNDLAQSRGIAQYISKDLKMKKISIIAMNDEYGNGLVNEFKQRFSEFGGKIQKVEWFNPDATDFRSQIAKLETSEFEILFIIANPGNHPQIAKQLKELGKDWRRIAEFNFGVVPEDATNNAMKGTLYPSAVFDATATKNAQYLQECMRTEGLEPDMVTAWGFDALYTFAKAAEKCSEVNADCVRENLIGLHFDGAAGKNSFTEDGEVTEIHWSIIEFE